MVWPFKRRETMTPKDPDDSLEARRERIAWMFPPEDMHDPDAWMKYWKDQVEHKIGLQFVDMFCQDDELVRAMQRNGLNRVLCAGCGLSYEPRALQAAGFDVTALDICPPVTEMISSPPLDDRWLANVYDVSLRREGGTITPAPGDLTDPRIAPGPFDVILERRTLQDFPEDEFDSAMQAMVNRLATPGIFFSHCHDGGFNPSEDAEPRHRTCDWFKANGWKMHEHGSSAPITGQVAWVFTSTG